MNSLKRTLLCSALAVLAATAADAATCEGLSTLNLPQTTVTVARVVRAGEFVAPSSTANVPPPIFKRLPAFCRVEGVIRPVPDSHIQFEVWLPVSGWNSRYLGIGNGGFAGSLRYTASNAVDIMASMSTALAGGYATAGTDTGHRGGGSDATWALGHREQLVDYGYRAIHETAVRAKAIISAFYETAPTKSYFNACSNGGRQKLRRNS